MKKKLKTSSAKKFPFPDGRILHLEMFEYNGNRYPNHPIIYGKRGATLTIDDVMYESDTSDSESDTSDSESGTSDSENDTTDGRKVCAKILGHTEAPNSLWNMSDMVKYRAALWSFLKLPALVFYHV